MYVGNIAEQQNMVLNMTGEGRLYFRVGLSYAARDVNISVRIGS